MKFWCLFVYVSLFMCSKSLLIFSVKRKYTLSNFRFFFLLNIVFYCKKKNKHWSLVSALLFVFFNYIQLHFFDVDATSPRLPKSWSQNLFEHIIENNFVVMYCEYHDMMLSLLATNYDENTLHLRIIMVILNLKSFLVSELLKK